MMLLNLTSPTAHHTLTLKANIAIARTVVVVVCVGVVAFIASSFIGGSLLEQRVRTTQQEADRSTLLLSTQGKASITETTKRLNTQVTELQKVQNRYMQWTPLIEKFSALTPLGITLQSISLSQKTSVLVFEATATTREAYVAYEKILQKSPLFSNVQFPLQTKRSEITFTYSLTVVGLPQP